MAKKQGRNPMAGRHAVGQQTARPGSIRGGQSEPIGNRPITSSRPAMRPQTPVLGNQAETSRTAQRMVLRPPMPFANPGETVNVPAPAHKTFKQGISYENRSAVNAKPQSYGTHVGCANTSTTDDMLAAVGERRVPKGYHPLISGNPLGGRKQSGRPGTSSKGTSGRENARVRQRG